MRPIYNKVIGTCASILMVSCQQDIPMVSLGVDSQYRIERMRKLILRPEFTGEAYRWTLKDSDGADSTVSTEREFIFATMRAPRPARACPHSRSIRSSNVGAS